MKPVNILLTLLSLNAVLVIIERLSPTTQIILQPYSFLRLHEVVQMLFVILISVVISVLLLKALSRNFELLKTRYGTVLMILFAIGLYLNSTGNGLHEVASYLFNTFCNTKRIETEACASMYFNDYYFGNIVYFAGLLLSNVALILLERKNPSKDFKTRDIAITAFNGLVYGLTLFAYAAFDKVLVGFWFTIIAAFSVDYLLFAAKKSYSSLPFTLYCAVGYTVSSIATLVVRFR